MNRKVVILALFVFLIPLQGICQFDSIVNKMQREFDLFKKGIEKEHQQFKIKNDSVFSAFLKESWESFHVFFNANPVEKPKPVIQPVISKSQETKKPAEEIVPADSSKTGSNFLPTKIRNGPELKELPAEKGSTNETALLVEYYGTSLPITVSFVMPGLKLLNGNGISNYFDLVSNSESFQQFVKQLLFIKREKKLNDWGYLQLVRNAAKKITTTDNEAELFSWITLLKSGINAKVGYSEDQVFLLVPCLDNIYVSWYIRINERLFYIMTEGTTKEKLSSLVVHKADYPGNLPISLEINELPLLDKELTFREFSFRNLKFTISMNSNLMEFFSTYPQCNLNIFFATPLSEQILNSLDTFLIPKMKNLSDRQKIAMLLEFTQKTFAYKSDRDQFNREKFFFPDELFFYPYSDCEDRAILFTRLVKHYTGLHCIGLDYPKHVNTAVAMGENAEGDFIRYNKQKYLICDPTYINAPVGYLPKEYDAINPEIINFE